MSTAEKWVIVEKVLEAAIGGQAYGVVDAIREAIREEISKATGDGNEDQSAPAPTDPLPHLVAVGEDEEGWQKETMSNGWFRSEWVLAQLDAIYRDIKRGELPRDMHLRSYVVAVAAGKATKSAAGFSKWQAIASNRTVYGTDDEDATVEFFLRCAIASILGPRYPDAGAYVRTHVDWLIYEKLEAEAAQRYQEAS